MLSTFGQEQGHALPDLRGVSLALDRGYGQAGIVFGMILEAGASFEGTVQRVSSNATYFC